MSVDAITLARAHLALAELQERENEWPKWDWYGTDCGCGPESRKPLGDCSVHKRAHINQRPPEGDWSTWYFEAGRGSGKTEAGAQWIRAKAREKGKNGRFALVGATAADVRDTMVEGPSGILASCPEWERPVYQPSKRRVVWPNGAVAMMYSADEPERLRGPQHTDAWCIAKGSLIETESGPRPIEEVTVGTMVWTRRGLRRVRKSGLTAAQVPVLRITTTAGASLRLTANHRVAVAGMGWIEASYLLAGDKLILWDPNQALPHGSTGTDSAGTATAMDTTRTGPAPCSTPQSGNSQTASAYPPAWRSITTTRTSRATSSTISSSSRSPIMPGFISPPEMKPTPGCNPSPATRPASGRITSGRNASPETSFALDAERPTNRPGCDRNSARPIAPQGTSVSSVEPDGRADVYDLSVDGEHEFFAGSLLVHNCDELAAWHDARPWDMLMFGMRLGDNPQTMVTTTPKPFPWLRRIKKLVGTTITKGTSYDNRDNLARNFFDTIIKPFEGTRQGRQELLAEDLEDTPGALWSIDLLDQLRIPRNLLPEFIRIVVAVDPSVADPKADPDNDTAECGITVGAMAYVHHPTLGMVPMGYLFADRSLKAHPHDWGRAVVNAYHEFKADCVVAESNNGGALVSSNIQTIDPSVPVTLIHASRGKLTRAEPVATMYEQRRVWHVEGEDFSLLESQMCNWVPGLPSPDRMDALVWLFTTLLLEGAPLEMGPSPWADWRGD